MKRRLSVLVAVFAVLAVAGSASAQVYQVYYPSPVTTYYAPAPAMAPVVAPSPVVAYYPTAVPVTRYRPFIGGTVTRWRYVNQPVVYPTTAYYPVW